MHVLEFMLEIYVIGTNNKIGIIVWLGIIYFTISQERNSVKIVTRSSISPKFQTKVDSKVTASR